MGTGNGKGAASKWLAVLSREEDLLGAIEDCQQQGFQAVEIYSPYPVEGAEEALGRRATRLPLVCLLLGLLGLVAALLFQFWASDTSWKMNIGGKPDNSIWAFLPVTFEMTVLAAALGTTVVFMMRCLLFPGIKPRLVASGVLDDAFALVIGETPKARGREKLEEILERRRPQSLLSYDGDWGPSLPWGLLVGFVVVGLLWAGLMYAVKTFYAFDAHQRPHEWATEMVYSEAYGPFEPNPNFKDERSQRPPLAGSVARGQMALPFPRTAAGAEAAGEVLHNPFAADPTGTLERGKLVFEAFCMVCHGAKGLGDGIMVSKGVPRPLSLVGEDAVKQKDGALFFTITKGRAAMPAHAFQLSSADRWKVVRYIKHLQGSGK